MNNPKEEFVRLYFLAHHLLDVGGAQVSHELGKYYHVSRAYADKLIADGIARLDTVHEQLLKDAEEQKALSSQPAVISEKAPTAESPESTEDKDA
ncbi:MAG: hypothetical protein JWO13_2281 [Acidobacteriales bacterium]|nr:hypothetical protein [Terriglobales bacterium]